MRALNLQNLPLPNFHHSNLSFHGNRVEKAAGSQQAASSWEWELSFVTFHYWMPAACQCAKLPRLLKSGLLSIWGGKIKLIYSFLSLDCHSKFQEGKWANESWSVQLHWAPHNQSFANQLGLSFHNFHVLKAFCLKFCVCGHVHAYCGTFILYGPVSFYLYNYEPFLHTA